MTTRGRDNRAGWEPWLARLDAARARSLEMGGPERIERQVHSQGKLDVRQRVAALFDPGSFNEIGSLVGNKEDLPADGFVCGFGRIGGRPVAAGAEDFTIKAGSVGSGGGYKRYRIAELAVQEGVPLVWMKEGAGARMGVRTSTPARTPNDLEPMADAKGEVPVVCLVLGVSAGHGALAAPMADFVVMTERSAIFTGGPDLVRAATGEVVTAEELGGWRVAVEQAGTVHNVVADDAAAIALARHYLEYFPSNRHGLAPTVAGPDGGPRPTPELLDIIPANNRSPYDVRDVITALVDDHRFLEVQPLYGTSISVGWAHVGGRAVGFVANNPARRAGALDAPAAIKATDFLEIADTFGHPIVFLLDNPGVLAGTQAEKAGVLKWGGRMYLAGRRLRSPKISVLMRKGFGFGLVTMAHMPHDRQTLVLALPSANIATMPAQSGGRTANLDDATRDKIEQAQRGGPYGLADRLGVDQVVDPRELRNAIIAGFAMTDARPHRR
ncbi:MAG: carboxyl transferase domain-containing protein [Ilumatobacteraceae bacterium]